MSEPTGGLLRTSALTALTLIAFAANSLLCRMALADGSIDPTTFTSVRLLSGAAVLVPLVLVRGSSAKAGSWPSGLALFVYAIAFSWAYVSLSTGTGALLLFGAVQATMIGVALFSGERPSAAEWIGGVAAFGGLVYLVLPGVSAPAPLASALMIASGVAWGVYSLRGRGLPDATAATAGNFARSIPFVVTASALAFARFDVSARGLVLAAVSGAITSGLGYAIWYVTLRGHTATSAAIVQLAVPLLAALAGVVVLDEKVTLRLAVASVLILGGVAAAVLGKRRGLKP
jgi:drug/metabolite transporter (DMT)-like permease